MTEWSAEQISQTAYDLHLINERQLQELWTEFTTRTPTPEELIHFLLRKEYVTNFQLERMFRGERTGFFYGDYKIQYMISGGSFARVYRAIHRETGQVVALKVLRKRYADNKDQTDYFCREGRLGMSLRHPNICPVFEVHSKALTHFLVLEFIEGRNLREFLKVRKELAPMEATQIVSGICSALCYAFDRKIYHRDLKLTNVMISSLGQPKLLDFGLANLENSDLEESNRFEELPNQRTIDYAGLEQATQVRKGDPRSDIYFLGAIYYYLLSGTSPLLETKDKVQRVSKSRFLNVVPIHQAVPQIPRGVASIVNQAMELDPDRRYQTPHHMQMDLANAIERLAAGDTEVAVEGETDSESLATPLRETPQKIIPSSLSPYIPPSMRRAWMVVESAAKYQDVFREALKKDGYRALIIGNPQLALERFLPPDKGADGLILGTTELGESVIELFEKLCSMEHLSDLPIILLLDPKHKKLADRIRPLLGPNRLAMMLPIKLKQLRETLGKLVPVGGMVG